LFADVARETGYDYFNAATVIQSSPIDYIHFEAARVKVVVASFMRPAAA
jgi:hypothetical protein